MHREQFPTLQSTEPSFSIEGGAATFLLQSTDKLVNLYTYDYLEYYDPEQAVWIEVKSKGQVYLESGELVYFIRAGTETTMLPNMTQEIVMGLDYLELYGPGTYRLVQPCNLLYREDFRNPDALYTPWTLVSNPFELTG